MTTVDHFQTTDGMFIKGAVIRYVHLPQEAVDLEAIQEATLEEMSSVEA